MNECTKRINQAYRWLIWLGEVDDKLSFAQRLGKERANITNILNGKMGASDRFCGLILASFPGIFNRDWLLDGTGDMLTTAKGLPTFPVVGSVADVESDTPDQRQSIIDLYAGLIKESEAFRREIKDESNKIVSTITHRPLDIRHRVEEEDEFIFEQEPIDDDELMLLTDEDWNDEFWEEESSVNPD